MKTTRIDISERSELISNRISYLDSELEKIKKELRVLEDEKHLLDSLHSLYLYNNDDPIDNVRSKITFIDQESSMRTKSTTPIIFAQFTRPEIREAVLDVLKKRGPSTAAEIAIEYEFNKADKNILYTVLVDLRKRLTNPIYYNRHTKIYSLTEPQEETYNA